MSGAGNLRPKALGEQLRAGRGKHFVKVQTQVNCPDLRHDRTLQDKSAGHWRRFTTH